MFVWRLIEPAAGDAQLSRSAVLPRVFPRANSSVHRTAVFAKSITAAQFTLLALRERPAEKFSSV